MEFFGTSAIFAGINSAFKFAEVAVRIAEVGTENEVFVRTITVVRNDLDETQRLLSEPSVQKKLLKTPTKLDWIKRCIDSTQRALYEIGKWVERARVDQAATGSVKFETRVRWVFNNHEKLVNRQVELSACHQQLSGVLAYLTPLEDPENNHDPPSFDQITKFEDMLSPRQRRRQTYQQAQTSQSYRLENASADGTRPGADEFTQRSQSFPTTTTSVVPTTAPSTTPLAISEPMMAAVPLDAACIPVPSSPPPSYVAATRPISAIPSGSNDHRVLSQIPRKPISSTLSPSSYQITAEKPESEVCRYSPGQTTPEKGNREIYAHYAESQIATYPNSNSMSATNYSGPVDPLAMLYELANTTVQKTQLVPASDTSKPAEAPGDSLFPVELSTNDPGPPPGYPRSRTRTKISSSGRFTPSSPYSPFQPVSSSVSELPTTHPRSQPSSAPEVHESLLRRRALSDTIPSRISDSFPEVCEMTTDQPRQFWGPPPTASHLASASSFQSSTSSVPTLSSFQSSASSVPTISSFQSSTGSLPTISSSHSSTSTAPIMPFYGSSTTFIPKTPSLSSSRPQEISSTVYPSQDTTDSASEPQPQLTKTLETAKTRRIRSQKAYMDMLSNLELT